VSHSTSLMVKAQAIREADPDRSINSIAHELGVCHETVKRWVVPGWNEYVLDRNRASTKLDGRVSRRTLERMVTLRLAGLSNRAVAVVLEIDGKGRFSEDAVRRYVRLHSSAEPGRARAGMSKDVRENWGARG
jgi:transposase-like protein